MMHTVMTGCNKDVFKYPELSDKPGMYKKRVKSMNQQHTGNHTWWEAYHWQNRPESGAYNSLENSNSRRNRIIEIFTLMMYHMHSPENIDFMSKPVIPIPHKICRDQ